MLPERCLCLRPRSLEQAVGLSSDKKAATEPDEAHYRKGQDYDHGLIVVSQTRRTPGGGTGGPRGCCRKALGHLAIFNTGPYILLPSRSTAPTWAPGAGTSPIRWPGPGPPTHGALDAAAEMTESGLGRWPRQPELSGRRYKSEAPSRPSSMSSRDSSAAKRHSACSDGTEDPECLRPGISVAALSMLRLRLAN